MLTGQLLPNQGLCTKIPKKTANAKKLSHRGISRFYFLCLKGVSQDILGDLLGALLGSRAVFSFDLIVNFKNFKTFRTRMPYIIIISLHINREI